MKHLNDQGSRETDRSVCLFEFKITDPVVKILRKKKKKSNPGIHLICAAISSSRQDSLFGT